MLEKMTESLFKEAMTGIAKRVWEKEMGALFRDRNDPSFGNNSLKQTTTRVVEKIITEMIVKEINNNPEILAMIKQKAQEAVNNKIEVGLKNIQLLVKDY